MLMRSTLKIMVVRITCPFPSGVLIYRGQGRDGVEPGGPSGKFPAARRGGEGQPPPLPPLYLCLSLDVTRTPSTHLQVVRQASKLYYGTSQSSINA